MFGRLFYLKKSYNFVLHNVQLKIFLSHNLNFVVSFLFCYEDSIDLFSLVLFIIITLITYVMARAYMYCLLILKQCICGLVCPRNGSDL